MVGTNSLRSIGLYLLLVYTVVDSYAMDYSYIVRFVDRYIGACACFVLTVLHQFRRAPSDRKTKNVLVIELVEMGASIMAYSSLRYIKREIPGAKIFVLCTASTKEPWMLLEGISRENVFALDNRSFSTLIASIIRHVRILSRKNIDLIIDFELFTRVSAIIAFLIRAKRRAGFYGYTMGGLYRGNFLDVKCNFNQNMHIAKNLLALTKSALDTHPRYYNWEGPIATSEIIEPTYRSDPMIASTVKRKLSAAIKDYAGEPLILVAPTVGRMLPMRDYPKDRYAEVVQKLRLRYPKHFMVLVGTNEHKAVTGYICEKIRDEHCVDFAGSTATLRELLELFLLGDVLISNDSGNPHFAAMTGLKTVAIYGPETPFMYGPLGKAVCLYDFFHSSPSITSYNHKNPPSDDTASLKSIHPDRVVATVDLLMTNRAAYRTVNNQIPYLL